MQLDNADRAYCVIQAAALVKHIITPQIAYENLARRAGVDIDTICRVAGIQVDLPEKLLQAYRDALATKAPAVFFPHQGEGFVG